MKQPTTEQVAQWLDEAISAYMTQDGHFWHVAQQAYAAGAASRDAEIADAQELNERLQPQIEFAVRVGTALEQQRNELRAELAALRAESAGQQSAINQLSAIFDQQYKLLSEMEDGFGRDGHGGKLEDGESELVDRVRDHLAAFQISDSTALRAQDATANNVGDPYGYAKRLAIAIWELHWKDDAPHWVPCDDLISVLTQIDNMTCTLQKAAPTVQEPVGWLYPEGLEALRSGKPWTAYGTKQEDGNIPIYLDGTVAPKVEPPEMESGAGFESLPVSQPTPQEPVNQMLLDALNLAEAALSDIGDADREPGDDLAWCESRAAEAIPQVRAAIAAAEGVKE